MKPRILKFSLILLFLCLIPLASAGAGIKYGVESISIRDEWERCVEYGVYNPWNDNATLILSASGEIKQFALESEEVFVPAHTMHDNSIRREICFKPEVFSKDCAIGDWFLCRKECSEEEAPFKGEVLVSEVRVKGVGGTGSAATASAAAPLKITVKCEPYERNWWPVIFIIIAVAVLIVVFFIIRQIRKPATKAKKLKRYDRLQAKLKKLKKEIKK